MAAEAGRIWARRYPGLQIAGAYPGSPAEDEREEIAARITAAGADLLFVAFGAPAQDLWIARNRDRLPTVRLALGVGGVFDYVTGRVPLAPAPVAAGGPGMALPALQTTLALAAQLALPAFVLAVLGQRLGPDPAPAERRMPHDRPRPAARCACRWPTCAPTPAR